MPGLRRVEHHAGAALESGETRCGKREKRGKQRNGSAGGRDGRSDRTRRRGASVKRHPRTGSRSGRRRRARQRRFDRRRPRHRQIHAFIAAFGQHRRNGAEGALRFRRRISAPDRDARAQNGRGRVAGEAFVAHGGLRHSRRDREGSARRRHYRLDPDDGLRRRLRCAGKRDAGARIGGAVSALCKTERGGILSRRPCDEGRFARRTARAGAYGRHRALF